MEARARGTVVVLLALLVFGARTAGVADGKAVDARYTSAKPHEFFGSTYSFDVAFRADIARTAKPRAASSTK